MRRTSLVAPLLLIAIGVLFLARNIYPDLPVAAFIAQYWPFVLIAWGALRLAEILYWSATSRPLPVHGVSRGEWLSVILICLFGASFHTAHNFVTSREGAWTTNWTNNWPLQFPWGDVNIFGQRFEYPVNLEHAASKAPRIVIDDFRGDLQITGSDKDTVNIIGRKSIGAIDKAVADRADAASNVEITGDANELTIHLKDNFRGPARVSSALNLAVPKGAQIEARRRDGDLRITGIDGPINVSGRGSDISLADLGGPVSIRGNFNGTLHAHHVANALDFKGRQTEFQVQKISGDLTVDRGDFAATDVMGPMNISSRSNDVKVTGFTNALNVTLDRGDLDLEPARLPLSPIQAQSRSGDIRLALPPDAQFTLNATTDSGDIANSFGAALKAESRGSHQALHGAVGSGPAINLVTRRGDIAVRKSGTTAISDTL